MKKFFWSFIYAFRGVYYAIYSQRNMKVHLLAVLVVSLAGIFFSITTTEWLAIILCFSLVIGLEMVNTAVELLADKLHPEKDEQIGKAKDVAAGAVLVAAIFSVLVTVMIFGKYFV
jgi:diacylglycerol kinase